MNRTITGLTRTIAAIATATLVIAACGGGSSNSSSHRQLNAALDCYIDDDAKTAAVSAAQAAVINAAPTPAAQTPADARIAALALQATSTSEAAAARTEAETARRILEPFGIAYALSLSALNNARRTNADPPASFMSDARIAALALQATRTSEAAAARTEAETARNSHIAQYQPYLDANRAVNIARGSKAAPADIAALETILRSLDAASMSKYPAWRQAVEASERADAALTAANDALVALAPTERTAYVAALQSAEYAAAAAEIPYRQAWRAAVAASDRADAALTAANDALAALAATPTTAVSTTDAPTTDVVLTLAQQNAASALLAAQTQGLCAETVSSDPVSSTDETAVPAFQMVDVECVVELRYSELDSIFTIAGCDDATKISVLSGAILSECDQNACAFEIGDTVVSYTIYVGDVVISTGTFERSEGTKSESVVYQVAVSTDAVTTDAVSTDAVSTDAVSTDPVTTDAVAADAVSSDSITCWAIVMANGASFRCVRPLDTRFFFTSSLSSVDQSFDGNENTIFETVGDAHDFSLVIYGGGVLVFNQAVTRGEYEFQVPKADLEIEDQGEPDMNILRGSFSPMVTPTFTISADSSAYVYIQFDSACGEQPISASITVDGVEIPFVAGRFDAPFAQFCYVMIDFDNGLPAGDQVGSVIVTNSDQGNYYVEGGSISFSSIPVSDNSQVATSTTSTAVATSTTSTTAATSTTSTTAATSTTSTTAATSTTSTTAATSTTNTAVPDSTTVSDSTVVSVTSSAEKPALVLPFVEFQLPVESIVVESAVVEGSTQSNSGVPVIPIGVTSMVCASDCIATLFDKAGVDAFSIVLSVGGESVVVTRASQEVRVPVTLGAKAITAVALTADGVTIAQLSTPVHQMSMKELRMMTSTQSTKIKPAASKPNDSQNNLPYVLVGLMLIGILVLINARRKSAITKG